MVSIIVPIVQNFKSICHFLTPNLDVVVFKGISKLHQVFNSDILRLLKVLRKTKWNHWIPEQKLVQIPRARSSEGDSDLRSCAGAFRLTRVFVTFLRPCLLVCFQTASDTAAFGGLSNRDWSDAQRTSAEPHWLSLEGLNLEVADDLEPAPMTSPAASSRQQLLEEVLQTKELLQNKQRHKNSGVTKAARAASGDCRAPGQRV